MPKPKLVNWQLIDQSDNEYTVVYDLIEKHHADLKEKGVIVLLMWRHNLKLDQDGYILLADITKTPDKYRELREHDFIIGINKDAWSTFDQQQKDVVIDTQLERIAFSLDKEDNIKEDDRSRNIYRLRNAANIDHETIKRRHNLVISDVVDVIVSKMTIGNAQKNSYVASQLVANP